MQNPYSQIDAINQVTEVLVPFSWTLANLTAGDTTSIYAVADQFLDRARIEICSAGLDGNVENAVPYTAASYKVTLTAQVPTDYAELSVRGAGPDAYRNIALRYDSTGSLVRPYDLDNRTFNVTTAATGILYLDVIRLLPWSSLTVKSAEAVIAKAKLAFMRRYAPEQLKDAQLQQELSMTSSAQGDQMRQQEAAAIARAQQGGGR